jgi:hypothetical protein
MADVRDYLEQQLNRAIRRPGMFGGELALRLYCDALAVADDIEGGWGRVQDGLRAWGAFVSTGVTGAVEQVLGRKAEDVMASVCADVARDHGWLRMDSVMDPPDYARVLGEFREWCERGGKESDVRREYGRPSAVLGGGSAHTLVYGTSRPADRLVFFHLAGVPLGGQPGTMGGELELIAGRSGGETFSAGFTFTSRWMMSRNGQA